MRSMHAWLSHPTPTVPAYLALPQPGAPIACRLAPAAGPLHTGQKQLQGEGASQPLRQKASGCRRPVQRRQYM